VAPGVWKFTFGVPEKVTPVSTRHFPPASDFSVLPSVGECPITVGAAAGRGGYLVRIPLERNEVVYGLGLQFLSFIQRGLKKMLRVNADPKVDSGDSHAPVPFYVTTRGYGVLIDTARYLTIYSGNKQRKSTRGQKAESAAIHGGALPEAYRRYNIGQASEVLAEIPRTAGIDVYVFAGPTMRQAVQRYNLFSGGGTLPPRWGLGVWYRCEKDYAQEDVLRLARQFRESRMPCDVLGLEPGWQTHSYSCSFVWSDRFRDPAAMIRQLSANHYRLNLWEHAYTHPSSPIHGSLYRHSGDYEVWGGLAPDFLDLEARRIFSGFHEKEHVALGVSGYKLDECDNSDFTGNWSFPEISAFPSGADGEQMHSLFGLRYQDAILSIFERRKQRTYGLVRSSQALAAPYPHVLYSDLYDHREFIRALVNSGFSGLLWTPEVRDAKSAEDLVRRLQTAVLSPMALINAWYIKNPPWMQIDREANNAGRINPQWKDLEAQCRRLMELRMQLLPYLHAAFARYHREGLPPFRALVMDWPEDKATWGIDNQYMMGDALLVAPVVAGESEREIYLPEGEWFDFWTNQRHAGGQSMKRNVPLEHIPVFVKAGAILPLATPTLHSEDAAGFEIRAVAYGHGSATATIYEDDGGVPGSLTEVRLSWEMAQPEGAVSRIGPAQSRPYRVTQWRRVS
jgi:alpha-D-xyloside xylohydrolase